MLKIFCWCLFDFATTVFMMNIVSLSFLQWLDQTFGNGQQLNGIIAAVAYALTLLLYPFTGPICDKGHRMFPLGLLTGLSILAVAGLGWCTTVWMAGFLFVITYLTYQLALTFYNALLDDVSTVQQRGIISGIGVAFRYAGALFGLFVINFFIKGNGQLQLPEFLHWMIVTPCSPGETLYVNAFLPTAILYFIFTIPLFLVMRPSKKSDISLPVSSALAVGQSKTENSKKTDDSAPTTTPTNPLTMMFTNCAAALRQHNTRWLLMTILLSGIPVYAAVGFMSKFLEAIGGIPKSDLIKFLGFATVFSILGGVGFGLFMRKLGNRLSFSIILGIWAINLLVSTVVSGSQIMWVIGALCGVGMGGYWAVSRILVLDITPPGQQGQYLSLYWAAVTICGIASSLLWPACVELATYCNVGFAPERISTLVMGILSLSSIFIFYHVRFETKK